MNRGEGVEVCYLKFQKASDFFNHRHTDQNLKAFAAHADVNTADIPGPESRAIIRRNAVQQGASWACHRAPALPDKCQRQNEQIGKPVLCSQTT